ncbi:MAG: uracil-DNA glycosylase [Desulfobacteraceae bacterium]|nr:MAG: uracil-DNA glycosylase [Desulfobacteraceae bacterium]
MMPLPATIDDTLLSLRHSLQLIARWGCRGFECSPETLEILEQWSRPAVHAKKQDTLAQIRSEMGECRRCGLSAQRTHIVFGEGAPRADLVFVGEGPGFEEDRSGRPFVGPAGQLLTRIIEAMHLTREQVYICNVVKCRPPGNRNPETDEIKACRPFLQRQLAVIRPKVICALGTFAAQVLLDSTQPISQLRGRFHDINGIKVMPTFHPSYLLRNPDRKRDVWEDMKKIMLLLRLPL